MKVSKDIVQREVIEYVKEDIYTVELNYEEACALQAILGSIGGTVVVNNPRTHTDALYAELSKTGIKYHLEDVRKYAGNIVRSPEVGSRQGVSF